MALRKLASIQQVLAIDPIPDADNREGIVIRPRDEELYSPAVGGRLSIKVIADDYALAEKD